MSRLAERQRPLRREEYERMISAGLFRNERVELIHGIVVRMSPQNEPRAIVIQLLNRVLTPALIGRADVRVQLPFTAGADSLPEPDLAVVPVGRFGQARPGRAFLIIEVADSSIDDDRTDKLGIYAAAGVPEYWIVNIPLRAIEVYRAPRGGAYDSLNHFSAGQRVGLAEFADVAVDVAELFATAPLP